MPDAKTVWLFRECLTQAVAIETLFDRFNAILRNAGFPDDVFGRGLNCPGFCRDVFYLI